MSSAVAGRPIDEQHWIALYESENAKTHPITGHIYLPHGSTREQAMAKAEESLHSIGTYKTYGPSSPQGQIRRGATSITNLERIK